MDLLVLCPTRGRPLDALETKKSFEATNAGRSELMFIVDSDDSRLSQYVKNGTVIQVPPLGNMVAALNTGAFEAMEFFNPKYLGFVGDDHRFRTLGWDVQVVEELNRMGGGFVYGDDLAQRWRLPTQIFMNASIVRALGWMALPTCKHLYVDNAWMELGKAIKRFHYLPDVVIEHLHPAYGKGEWDENHVRVNSPEMYDHDGKAFERWMQHGGFEADVERVVGIL